MDDEKKTAENRAAAISYDRESGAPKVIARGRGEVADRIIKKAEEAGVPVHTDEAVAQTLSNMDLGSLIPYELFEAVAQIYLHIEKVDKILKGDKDGHDEKNDDI